MKWIEKHQPQNYSDMVGLTETLETIESFILSGDIPHLLFHGEQPGTGKTTAANITARKILGEHFDGNFIEINASDERTIVKMRKVVLNALRHKPLFSDIKIIFLDEADGLLDDAQDILKTPMQKTKNTIFIIACNDITKIIKPIISRCTVFEFKQIPEKEIVKGLKAILLKEKIGIEDGLLQDIAKKVDGDMRAAVGELQKAVAMNHRNSEIDKIVKQYLDREKQGVVSQP